MEEDAMQLFDGSQEEYAKDVARLNAEQRLRDSRTWNRSDGLDFLEAYIRCAVKLTPNATRERVSLMSDGPYSEMEEDTLAFIRANMSDLYELSAAWCGQEFWLARNGHETSYWGTEADTVDARLLEASRAAGTARLVDGRDGRLYYVTG